MRNKFISGALIKCCVFLGFVTFIILAGLATATEKTSGTLETTIGKDISVKVLGLRAWSPPEQKFTLIEKIPDREFIFFWRLDNVGLARSLMILAEEGQEEAVKTVKTGSAFSRKVVKLTPPRGKFLEILLFFTNIGKETVEKSLSMAHGSNLDFSLVLPDGRNNYSVDFLFPGLNGGRLSELKALQKKGLTVVSELRLAPNGEIGTYLEPNGETWVLLLFDVPSGIKSAELQIKDAKPIRIQWK